MPFDPNLPQENTPVDAVQMRGQLNGLKDLIDAVGSITAVVVDAVISLPPGDPATVSISLTGTTLHFTFGIPEGQTGPQGMPGNDGGPGPVGPQGPPFAQAVVDAVNTLPPGSPASVGVNFDGTHVRFTFEIPQGYEGPAGAQGEPGEVSQAQLDTAISGTSPNTNNVGTLDTPFGDPDMEALRQKLNELILNGRR
ncbi:MAG: hypothetical protein HS117_04575 [Verrucomicrobiaceae bacterium]|nr:hypothetical protein [Verrucomicrobiaceae bacterium]